MLMAGALPMASSVQTQFVAHANSVLALQVVYSQPTWRTGAFLKVRNDHMVDNLLRLSNSFLSTPAATKHRGTTIAHAASTGQLERTITIQFNEEASITSEPLEPGQLKVTVSVTSKGTRKAWESVLGNLGRTAPAVKGFRKGKGGKTVIPRDVLYKMLGPSRVDGFVIDEIVSSAVLEHVEKENIKAKKDFKTVQSSEELAAAFKPGKEFDFTAILELEGDIEATALPEDIVDMETQIV